MTSPNTTSPAPPPSPNLSVHLRWQLLALTVLVGALFYWLAPILTPFVVSALLAYLADPLVDRLEKRGLGRTWAVTVVFSLMTLAMVGVVLLLIPLLGSQIERFSDSAPRYVAWFRDTALPWLEQRTGLSLESLEPGKLFALLQEHWQQAGGIAASVLGGISKSGLVLLAWIGNLTLIPVVTFYLLRDWDSLVARVHELLPRSVAPTISSLTRQSDEVLGGFLRGQISVMLALATVYSLGLWMVGIDLAFLIGMLAGLVSFIPYLGAIVGIGAGLIAALVQYGDWTHVILVLVVFGVGQTLESMLLTPWLVGDRIGLHPVAVIFAILAGGQLFGFLGVLVALPLAAVIMVLLRYAHEQYRASELYRAGEAVQLATEAPSATSASGVDAAAQAKDEAAALVASATEAAPSHENADESDIDRTA